MTTPTPHRIEPGQVYESCQPTSWASKGPEHTRIRILNVSGYGRVEVVTIAEDGRLLRPRRINARQLHPTGTTGTGEPRQTGYRLVRNAGTPAEGAQA